MKKLYTLILGLFILFSFSSCFVTTAAVNAVSTTLSGSNKKGNPKKSNSPNNAMEAITGESDVTLVADFFPTALKLYEITLTQNPYHVGLMSMTGSLNVMYANAFVQAPAELLSIDEFDKQLSEFERAKLHYLRGSDFCMSAIDRRHRKFLELIDSGKEENITSAVKLLDKKDVGSAYWAGAGWLGAFSLDPLNSELLGNLSAPVAILERAAELSPDYSNGAIWEVLARFYASAPRDFGGDPERALFCYNEAVRASEGKTPGPYIVYAECFCIPENDEAGFVEALNKAIAINPDDNPSTRLMTIISQNKARHLLETKSDYFLEW